MLFRSGGDRTKQRQENMFHGLGDNPDQGQLFGDIDKGSEKPDLSTREKVRNHFTLGKVD